jgi:hypothetical protein
VWIVILIVGLITLLGAGVLCVAVLVGVFFLRSGPVGPAGPVAASGPVVSTVTDVDNGDNRQNPDQGPDADVDREPKPGGPLPGEGPPAPPKRTPGATAKFAWRVGESREKMLIEGGGNAASQAVVDKGLDWLVSQQHKDGAWVCDGTDKTPAAGTALGLLPLLGAGHGARGANTKYADSVQRGLDFLMRLQRPTGQLGQTLYHHGLATLALCEAAALTDDGRVRTAAQKAIDFIVRAQHEAGGWRYQPRQPGDTSVTGWQVQALKAGQLAGLKVPATTTAGANRFLDSVASEKGLAYGYTTRAAGPTTSSFGLYSRVLIGWSPHQAEVLGGIERLKLDTLAPKPGAWDSYFCYFVTHLVFQVGGKPWEDWNAKVRDFLISAQLPGGDWPKDNGQVAGSGGKLASTSLALLTLEVYYRYPRPKPLIGD